MTYYYLIHALLKTLQEIGLTEHITFNKNEFLKYFCLFVTLVTIPKLTGSFKTILKIVFSSILIFCSTAQFTGNCG